MSWLSSETHSFVACDHPGCIATVGHREYMAGDEVDRVSACTYAADAALRAGWHVPADEGETADRCPAHRLADAAQEYLAADDAYDDACGDEATRHGATCAQYQRARKARGALESALAVLAKGGAK